VRTKQCSVSIARGRLSKANQFITAAETIRDIADEDDEVADAYVTLCVHAGIAASDVICCSSLGKHAQGESHDDATTLLASADKDAAKHLGALLRLKTKAGYGHTPATKDEVKKAARAADALIEKARRVRMLMNER
jgi:hypothetical protein